MRSLTQSPGNKVLVVDDDPFSRRLIADTLRAKSVEAIEVGDLATVVSRALDEHPHLILISGTAGRSDLGELVHRIRANPRLASIPVLLLRSTPGNAEGSSDGFTDRAVASADRCVNKPFSPLELLGAVDDLLTTPVKGAQPR